MKHRKARQAKARMESRIAMYERIRPEDRRAYHRPGSQNPHKGTGARK